MRKTTMSSTSNSGRYMLSAQTDSRGVCISSTETTVIHNCVESTSQTDTIYVYAYPMLTNQAQTTLELYVLDAENEEHTLLSAAIPVAPVASAKLVLNGYNKNNGARIIGRCSSGKVLLYGWVNRSIVSVPMSVKTMVGHLNLSFQNISFVGTETRHLSSSIPLTFVSSNHTTTTPAQGLLMAATQGTLKSIILISKHPSLLTDAEALEKGNVQIVLNNARFPSGVSGPAQGRLVLKEIGDSALLVYTGDFWMIMGSGCTAL